MEARCGLPHPIHHRHQQQPSVDSAGALRGHREKDQRAAQEARSLPTHDTQSLPSKEGSAHADKFALHIYAALAEQERDFISLRTKAALKKAKARGVKLEVSATPQ